MRLRSRVATAHLAAAATLLVSSCTLGGAGAGGQAEPTIGPAPVLVAGSVVQRPIDQYLPSRDRVTAVAQAQARITNDCLRTAAPGTTFVLGSTLSKFIDTEVGNRSARSNLWGFWADISDVSVHGYHYADPEASSYEATSRGGTDWTKINGCLDGARAASPGGKDWSAFLHTSTLPSGGPPMAIADSRVQAAQSAWVDCMDEQGFRFKSPLDAMLQYSPNPLTSPEEIATARADMDCKLQSNLVGIASTVQAAYDRGYIEANRPALESLSSDLDTFLAETAR